MAGPSLQLGVSAPGQDQLAGLNAELRQLRHNLTSLRDAKADLSGLAGAAAEIRRLGGEFLAADGEVKSAFVAIAESIRSGTGALVGEITGAGSRQRGAIAAEQGALAAEYSTGLAAYRAYAAEDLRAHQAHAAALAALPAARAPAAAVPALAAAATATTTEVPALAGAGNQINLLRRDIANQSAGLQTAFADLSETIRGGFQRVANETAVGAPKAKGIVRAEAAALQAEYEKMLAMQHQFTDAEIAAERARGVRLALAHRETLERANTQAGYQVGSAKIAEAQQVASLREQAQESIRIARLQVGSAKIAEAQEAASLREAAQESIRIARLQVGSARIAEAQQAASLREQAQESIRIARLQVGSARIAEAQREAADREAAARSAWIAKMQVGSAKIAEAQEAASLREAASESARIAKLQVGSARIAEAQREAADREAAARSAWIAKMQVGSLKIAEEVQAAADREVAAMRAAADRVQRAELAYQVRQPRQQVATQIRARVALDAGVAPKVVEENYGPTATGAAQAAAGVNVLQAAHRRAGEEASIHAEKTKSLNTVLRDLHSGTRGVASGFGAMFLTYGNLAPLLAGAAFSNAFVQIVKMGSAVEHTLEIVRVLGGNTAAEVDQLKQQLLELGARGPYGPLEIAKAMETLSLAGLSAKEQLAAVPDVLNFAIAGTQGIEEAAESMVTISKAFGYNAESYSRVGDLIVKTAAISVSSVKSIAESMKAATAVAEQYGVTLEDSLTQVALLSNVGIKNSAAGTSVRNFYSMLSGGNKKATDALRELGVQAIDPLTGKMKSLVDIANQLFPALNKKLPKDQIRIINDISNERGGKDVSALQQAFNTKTVGADGQASNKLADTQRQIREAYGAQAIASAELSLTTQNQMKSVAAALQTSFVSAFDGIQPSLIQVTQQLREAFGSDSFRSTIQGLGSSIANLTVFVVEHAGAIGTLIGAYVLYKAAVLGLAVTTTITGVMTAFGGAITAARAAMTAAAPAAIALAEANAATAAASLAASGGIATTAAATTTLGTVARVAGGAMAFLRAALGPLAIALSVGAALWGLFASTNATANITASDSARIVGDELVGALNKEASRLERRLELMRQGNSEQRIGIILDEEKARSEARGISLKTEAQAQAKVDAAKSAASTVNYSEPIYSPAGDVVGTADRTRIANAAELAAGVKRVTEAERELAQVKSTNAATEARVASATKRVVDTSIALEQERLKQQRAAQAEALKNAGTDPYGGGKKPKGPTIDSLVNKANALEVERLRGEIEEATQLQRRADEDRTRSIEDIRRAQQRGLASELDGIALTTDARDKAFATQLAQQQEIIKLQEQRAAIKNDDPQEAKAVAKAKGDLVKLQDARARNTQTGAEDISDVFRRNYERDSKAITDKTIAVRDEITSLEQERDNIGLSSVAVLQLQQARELATAAIMQQAVDQAEANGVSEQTLSIMRSELALQNERAKRTGLKIVIEDTPSFEKTLAAWRDTVQVMKEVYDDVVNGFINKGQELFSGLLRDGKLSITSLLDVVRDAVAKEIYQTQIAPVVAQAGKYVATTLFGERGAGGGGLLPGAAKSIGTSAVDSAASSTATSLTSLVSTGVTPLQTAFGTLVSIGLTPLETAMGTMVTTGMTPLQTAMGLVTAAAENAARALATVQGGGGGGGGGVNWAGLFTSDRGTASGAGGSGSGWSDLGGLSGGGGGITAKTSAPDSVLPVNQKAGQAAVAPSGGAVAQPLSIVIEDHSGGASKTQVKDRTKGDGSREIRFILDAVKSEMVDDVQRGGTQSTAMAEQFGLNRAQGLPRVAR